MISKKANQRTGLLILIAGIACGALCYNDHVRIDKRALLKEPSIEELRAQGVVVENYHLILDDASTVETHGYSLLTYIAALASIADIGCGITLLYRSCKE